MFVKNSPSVIPSFVLLLESLLRAVFDGDEKKPGDERELTELRLETESPLSLFSSSLLRALLLFTGNGGGEKESGS